MVAATASSESAVEVTSWTSGQSSAGTLRPTPRWSRSTTSRSLAATLKTVGAVNSSVSGSVGDPGPPLSTSSGGASVSVAGAMRAVASWMVAPSGWERSRGTVTNAQVTRAGRASPDNRPGGQSKGSGGAAWPAAGTAGSTLATSSSPIMSMRNRKDMWALPVVSSAPEGIRTPGLLIRSQVLYPAELPARRWQGYRPRLTTSKRCLSYGRPRRRPPLGPLGAAGLIGAVGGTGAAEPSGPDGPCGTGGAQRRTATGPAVAEASLGRGQTRPVALPASRR